MKPTHPIELLCCAIATQEGWFDADPNVIPRARHNPGDLDYAGQLNATGIKGEIATFHGNDQGTADQYGIIGLFRDIWALAAQGWTVRQMIEDWAPPPQNDTAAYLDNVLEWTGLPADTPLPQLLPPLVNLAVPD